VLEAVVELVAHVVGSVVNLGIDAVASRDRRRWVPGWLGVVVALVSCFFVPWWLAVVLLITLPVLGVLCGTWWQRRHEHRSKDASVAPPTRDHGDDDEGGGSVPDW